MSATVIATRSTLCLAGACAQTPWIVESPATNPAQRMPNRYLFIIESLSSVVPQSRPTGRARNASLPVLLVDTRHTLLRRSVDLGPPLTEIGYPLEGMSKCQNAGIVERPPRDLH